MIYYCKDGTMKHTKFDTESAEYIICPWCGQRMNRDDLKRDYDENVNVKIFQCVECLKWFELVEYFRTYQYERK